MTVEVIDERIALRWCQQQRPLMLRVFASFYQQYAEYLQPVALTPAQTQQLAHDLKSAAPSCGATALAATAGALAPPAAPPTQAAQNQLLKALAGVLHCIDTQYPEAIALIRDGQKDPIEELRRALEQHNLRALDLFRVWASQHARQWPDEVVNDIQHALNNFDFKLARSLLDAARSDTSKAAPDGT